MVKIVRQNNNNYIRLCCSSWSPWKRTHDPFYSSVSSCPLVHQIGNQARWQESSELLHHLNLASHTCTQFTYVITRRLTKICRNIVAFCLFLPSYIQIRTETDENNPKSGSLPFWRPFLVNVINGYHRSVACLVC